MSLAPILVVVKGRPVVLYRFASVASSLRIAVMLGGGRAILRLVEVVERPVEGDRK